MFLRMAKSIENTKMNCKCECEGKNRESSCVVLFRLDGKKMKNAF